MSQPLPARFHDLVRNGYISCSSPIDTTALIIGSPYQAATVSRYSDLCNLRIRSTLLSSVLASSRPAGRLALSPQYK